MKTVRKLKRIIISAAIFCCTVCAGLLSWSYVSGVENVPSIEEHFIADAGLTMQADFVADGDYLTDSYNGLRVNATQAGGIRFDHPVYVEENTADDLLTELTIIPQTVGQEDFSYMLVTLTDSEDPMNSIRIRLYTGNTRWYNSPNCVAIAAAAPQVSSFYYYSPQMGSANTNTVGGVVFSGCSFAGRSDINRKSSSIRLYLDYAERTIYAETDTTAKAFVADLSDYKYTGAGSEWNGFPSGKAYISYSFYDITGVTASALIVSINGNPMNGKILSDIKKPTLSVQEEEETPRGLVNTSYKIFPAKGYDDIDGDLPTSVQVSRNGKFYNVVSINGGKYFTPDTKGDYVLSYFCADKTGNLICESVNVFVEDYLIPLNYTLTPTDNDFDLNEDNQITVGEQVALPKGYVTGGSGKASVVLIVLHIETNEQVDVVNNRFTPMRSGTYLVKYSASDYLGQECTLTYVLECSYSQTPVIQTVETPKYFIIGKKYALNDFVATDYYSGASGVSALKKIVVTDSQKTQEFASDNAVYTASGKAGDTVTVSHIATSLADPDKKTVKSYTVKLVEPDTWGEYFYCGDGSTLSYIEGTNAAVYKATVEGATIDFINPLPAVDFNVQFEITEELGDYESLVLTLQDSVVSSERIELVLRRENKIPVLYVNGKYCSTVTGAFGEKSSDLISLTLDENCALYDIRSLKLCTLTETVNGESFDGFTSGKVYLSMSFCDLGTSGNAGVQVRRVCGQTLANRQGDNISPIIKHEGSLNSKYILGEIVKIPYAWSIDILDPNSTLVVSVLDEAGNPVTSLDGEVIQGLTATEDMFFCPTEVGEYRLVYEAKDAANADRPNVETHIINVEEDVKPTITIHGEILTCAGVGDALKVPSATVEDDSDENVKLYTFIAEPRGDISVVEDSYTFTQAGIYHLVYYAEDVYGNYRLLIFTIKVS